jgi:hypothetical protein
MKITNIASTMLLSTSLIVGQLQAAAPIDPERQPLGSIGPIELSNSDLSVGGVRAYRGWFENGAWQGDLIEYSVSTGGLLDTSIDLSTESPAQGGTNQFGEINWSAHVTFAAQAVDWWEKTTGIQRMIFTRNSDDDLQIPFRWDDLSYDQRKTLDPIAAGPDLASGAASSDILDYIRGDRSNESGNAGPLRKRLTMLGDIVHSNPEYVGAPEGSHSDSSYVAFKNLHQNRDGRVYVGANDGMLHAFNAGTGYEEWAYLPSMLFHKLTRLTGVEYAHRFYVDGGITVRDVELAGTWKTVLVGSLGAGGKGLYALDVTDPDLADESTTGKLMGELGADDFDHGDEIGYIFDATTITKLNDGKWYAINGNGIGSVDGEAKLLLIQLETGNVSLISTGSGDSLDPNGLSAPALLDTDGDGDTDIAWAGDVNGDMWRFDLTGSGSWNMDYKLFDGTEAQPITQAPDITNHPQFGYLVLFGTGKLYEPDDVTDTTVQAIYGVWDKGTTVTTSSMLSQQLTGDLTYEGETPDAIQVTEVVRTFNPVVPVNYGTHEGGWYINLPGGERVLTPPALRAGRLKSTVTDPDGFSNWFLEATFDEGSASYDSIFDLNRDSLLSDDGDHVDGDGNGASNLSDPEDIAMGWKRPNGNMSQVTIARLGPGDDTLFLNFLNPPLVEAPEPCIGNCDGGLEGGHMDVDTDHGTLPQLFKMKDGEIQYKDGVPQVLGDGYEGKTDAHKHEYDISHDRTYIDYFDIDPAGEGKPFPVDLVVEDSAREFIVLIANADWSPGGILTIGDVDYNVVVYQAMLHKALLKWRPGHPTKGTLEDPLGNPLIHTLDSIRADVDSDGNAGTLRTSFQATALIYGGLIPSRTGCVNGANLTPNNRWRSNALTMHLVDANYVIGDYVNGSGTGQPLDRLRVQDPTVNEAGDADGGSFYERIVLSDGTMIKLTGDDGSNGLEGGSPKYEVYGGLTAQNDESFLYESTVFWHWNSTDQPDICWSNTDAYRTEFKKFTSRTAVGFYLEKLSEETVFESFEELVAYLEASDNVACSASTCKDDYERAEALYKEGLAVYQVPSSDDDDEDGVVEYQTGSLTGDPVIIEGGISEGGLTSGPNFDTGRRTWIDILSE